MDVIALQQYGITGAVATLGTASNTEHLNILFKQNNRLRLLLTVMLQVKRPHAEL